MESFIPLWEWDVPKKRTPKKRRSDKGEKDGKGKGKEKAVEGGSSSAVPLADDSGSSRPESRTARIEEVPEES